MYYFGNGFINFLRLFVCFCTIFSIFKALYGNSSSNTNGGVEIRRVLQKHQDTTNYRTSGYNNNNNINLGISARVSSLEKCFSLPCQLSQCSESKKTIIRRQRHLTTKNSVTVMEVASNTATTGSCLVRTILLFFLEGKDLVYQIIRNCTSYFSRTFLNLRNC